MPHLGRQPVETRCAFSPAGRGLGSPAVQARRRWRSPRTAPGWLLQRRATDVAHRRRDLDQRRNALTTQRHQLTRDNQLCRRVHDIATRVLAVIDTLDFDQKQTLLRLVIEEVRITG
jgi:hypothetical protein